MNNQTIKFLMMSASAGAMAMTGAVTGAFAQDEPAAEEDVIIVEGRRAAIERASELERNADEFKSIVTADDIGQFGDQTVAESLQRIPGVSINRFGGEGQQVSIRGLPTEFATVTVDGARLGTTDDSINSTNLDFLSGDNLSQIEVVKTLTPERDADAIAGSVDLKTTSAFARGRNTQGIRVEVGYQEKNEAYNPKYSGEFTRIYDTDNGRWGIAGGITFQQRETSTDQLEVGDGLNYMVLADNDEWFQDGDVEDCNDTDFDGSAVVVDCYLIPNQADLENDLRDRERISLNGQLEWEVNNHLFALRGSYSSSETERIRSRVNPDFSRSDGDLADFSDPNNPNIDEVVSFGLNAAGNIAGVFEDGRAERRIRPAIEDEEVYTIGFSGTSEFGDDWTFDYGFDLSKNTLEANTLEGRFRADDITLDFADIGEDGISLVLGPEVFGGSSTDPTTPEGFLLRASTINGVSEGVGTNRRLADSEDSFDTFYADAERRFTLYGRDAAAKFGLKHRARERDYDFTRIEYLTATGLTLGNFATDPLVPHSDLNIPFHADFGATTAFLEDLIANGRIATPEERGSFITRIDLENDFTAEEDVTAGYAQLTFNPKDNVQVIAGVRVESTDYTTSGSAFRVVNYSDNVTNVLVAALQNGGVSQDDINAYVATRQDNSPVTQITSTNDYTDIFPSVNIRWEPTETTVVRLSYTEGIKRPEFREAAAIQQFATNEQVDDDDLCDVLEGTVDVGCTGTLTGSLASIADADALLAADGSGFESDGTNFRNPLLDPLISQNWDASWAWYPNERTVFSVAAYYKQIENFIAPIGLAGNDVTRVGLDVDDGTVNSTGVSSVNTFINGEDAEIYGVEFNYYQAYTFLPAPFDGSFVQANVTLADSEASAEQVDRVFPFPDQSDVIGNLSVGWENDVFSLRGAMVYQGERLRILNDAQLEDANNPAGDVYEQERTQFDIGARWEVRDGVQLYFDAINITDAEDNQFFQGGGDGVLNSSIVRQNENYGATYQLGVRARF